MLRTELSDDVFMHPSKGQLAEAYTLVATGHRKQGLDMLNEFVKDCGERKCRRRGINSKVQLYLEKAIRIRNAIEADTNNEKYLEQYKVEHKHTTAVKAVAYSANSKFLVSSAIDGTNLF